MTTMIRRNRLRRRKAAMRNIPSCQTHDDDVINPINYLLSQSSGLKGRKMIISVTLFCLVVSSSSIRPSLAAAASTGFPGTLPASSSSTFKSNNNEVKSDSAMEVPSSDDDESELESSSDFEDVEITSTPAAADEQHDKETPAQDEEESEDEDDEWSGAESDEAERTTQEIPIDFGGETDGEAAVIPSQPLKTLEKLQQMLDETDYMTESKGMRNPRRLTTTASEKALPAALDDPQLAPQSISTGATASDNTKAGPPPKLPTSKDTETVAAQPNRLWTSKDRQKYKKQQERLRRAKREQRRLEQQIRSSPPVHPNSSDDDAEASDTDDGLGYTLPNLPVYFSDTEGGTDLSDGEQFSPQHVIVGQQQQPPPPPLSHPGYYPAYPPHPGYGGPYNTLPPDTRQQIPPYMPPYQPSGYPPYSQSPYGPYSPQQQQVMASQYAAWAAASGIAPYSSATRPSVAQQYRPDTNSQEATKRNTVADRSSPSGRSEASPSESDRNLGTARDPSAHPTRENPLAPSFPVTQMQVAVLAPNVSRKSQLTFDSVQKLSILGVLVVSLAYCAVSPRNLPSMEYNWILLNNLKLVALALIAPTINFNLVFDASENDMNNVVSSFYNSFTVGYCLVFALELIFTTILRLGVFAWWEPDAFKLTPRVPALVLPWVLRENGYRPRRITLFAADFAASCVAAPVLEEWVKLKMLQLSVRLPRNFQWHIKRSSKSKKKRKVAEEIVRLPGELPVTNVNSYVTQMLAVSLGLKLCDTVRRIFMYTKTDNVDKEFYAFCRGIFPIQELCGTMTALALAQRDVLGVNMPLWKMLLPAVVIHGMANFRGMKPIFKWNSATPWSEMQLSPLHTAEAMSRAQMLNKAFPKVMWLIILARVLGYCVKNYYLIRRQAMKRTTTYAGKHSAFQAQLAATEALKQSKKE